MIAKKELLSRIQGLEASLGGVMSKVDLILSARGTFSRRLDEFESHANTVIDKSNGNFKATENRFNLINDYLGVEYHLEPGKPEEPSKYVLRKKAAAKSQAKPKK